MPFRERKICSHKYLYVLDNHICYWIAQVSLSHPMERLRKIYLVFETFDDTCIFCWYKDPIWHWIIILTRTNMIHVGYGFFQKFTEGACTGKKLLKRSAAKIYDIRWRYEQTRNVCITKYVRLYKLSNVIMVMTPK